MPPKRKTSPAASSVGSKRKAPPKKSTSPSSPKRRSAASTDVSTNDNGDSYDMASLPIETELTPRPASVASSALTTKKGRGKTPAARSSASVSAVGAAAAAAAEGSRDEKGGDSEDGEELNHESLGEMTLEALLRGADVRRTVDLVLKAYRDNHEQGLAGVLNLVAKASGVTEAELDASAMSADADTSALLEELYARVPQDSAAYLLINKDPKNKRFRRAFPEFCEQLVLLSYSGDLLLDGQLLPTLLHWLLSMSESKARSFRHTATVALLGILKGLNRLLADLKTRLALAKTKKETTELQACIKDIITWRDHVFSQSSHQRLRDVAPEIRLAVFQALKEFILEYPEEYLVNKYLRYFSMPLSDKKPELRVEALDMILQALAHVPDAYNSMYLFLQYCHERLVELCNDVDVRCGELALRVIALIARGDSEGAEGRELVSNAMMDRALMSLFDERPTIRTAAGVLLKVFIHCRTLVEETEAEQLKAASELLYSFASSLREHFREEMPEKYLVDALWSDDRPPLMLTEYKPLLAVADLSREQDVVVMLNLVAALLLRIRNRLTLGPLPKDDRRHHPTKKPSAEVKKATEDTYGALCVEMVPLLCSILGRHRGSAAVLRAVCGVVAATDVPALLAAGHSQTVSKSVAALVLELRKTTANVALAADDTATREALVSAWYAVAFAEHPLKSEAQAYLHDLLTVTTQRLSHIAPTAAGGATVSPSSSPGSKIKKGSQGSSSSSSGASEEQQVWGRFNVISSLVSVTSHWDYIIGSLRSALTPDAAASPALVGLIISTAVNAVLWSVSVAETSAALDQSTLATQLRDLIELLFVAVTPPNEGASSGSGAPASTSEAETETAWMDVRVGALVHLCDLAALQFYTITQSEQETLVSRFGTVFEPLSEALSAAQERLRQRVAQQSADFVLNEIARARAACTRLEAAQLRVVTGITRLFLLRRLHAQLAPHVLSFWTQTPSKTVADTFKSLFHAMRDRAGDSFDLERDVLLQSYYRCATVGATPQAVERLGQVGAKLASLHFLGTDRFPATCASIVQMGAQFAVSTDPVMLTAVTPYCAKLRPAEAMAVIRRDLMGSGSSFFVDNANPHVGTFVNALRRAARLEDGNGTGGGGGGADAALDGAAGGSLPRVSVKRSRELAAQPADLDDGILAEIAGGAPRAAGPAGRGRRGNTDANGKVSMATRVVTEDGWHVRTDEATTTLADADVAAVPDLPDLDAIPQSQGQHQQQKGGASSSQRGARQRSVVNVPTTQETVQSSLDDLENEEFIVTQEFD